METYHYPTRLRTIHVINLSYAFNSQTGGSTQLNMNMTLTPELEQLVQTKVARGEYDSADTFVSQAVQRLIDEESGKDADHGELRAD